MDGSSSAFLSADDNGEAAAAVAAAMGAASGAGDAAPGGAPRWAAAPTAAAAAAKAAPPEMVPVTLARLKQRASRCERMPMPPAIGPVLVRAYSAWIAALPDRIDGVPLPGEYHEALAALLLEQPRPGGQGHEGLTLVHFSPQLERFVWDRGCALGLCSPC